MHRSGGMGAGAAGGAGACGAAVVGSLVLGLDSAQRGHQYCYLNTTAVVDRKYDSAQQTLQMYVQDTRTMIHVMSVRHYDHTISWEEARAIVRRASSWPHPKILTYNTKQTPKVKQRRNHRIKPQRIRVYNTGPVWASLSCST